MIAFINRQVYFYLRIQKYPPCASGDYAVDFSSYPRHCTIEIGIKRPHHFIHTPDLLISHPLLPLHSYFHYGLVQQRL